MRRICGSRRAEGWSPDVPTTWKFTKLKWRFAGVPIVGIYYVFFRNLPCKPPSPPPQKKKKKKKKKGFNFGPPPPPHTHTHIFTKRSGSGHASLNIFEKKAAYIYSLTTNILRIRHNPTLYKSHDKDSFRMFQLSWHPCLRSST